jgi:phage terminase large subunit-like protein
MSYFPVPTINLKLHAAQAEVSRHPARFRVLVAGRRFGKTHLSKVEIIKAARGRGKRTIWYVAPTFSMAREIMWDELLDSIPDGWIAKKHETRLEIRLINGTVIQL